MTPEEQAQEFLSKPFRSRNILFEFNFYFTTESRGLMEVIYLLEEQVEFFRFDIDYSDEKPKIRFEDVETTLRTGDRILGINMTLSEALYHLTHEIETIWRKDHSNAIY